MTLLDPSDIPANQIWHFVLPLLNSDVVNNLGKLWQLGRRIVTAKAHEGMYEVLELDVRLELKDTDGQQAVVYKRERVRFVQDNIIAYQDKAWGDGDIFADYKCSPGVPVDRYKDGYRYRILISLRETKKRGDVEEFHMERMIYNGFTKNVESFQTDIDHPTRKMSLSIIFPDKRPPKTMLLVEQNTTRTQSLGPENWATLPDGRQQVMWSTTDPKLFEGYIMRWEW